MACNVAAAGEVDFEEFSSWYQGFVGAQEGEEEATASMGKFFNRLSPAKRREKKELEVPTCRLACRDLCCDLLRCCDLFANRCDLFAVSVQLGCGAVIDRAVLVMAQAEEQRKAAQTVFSSIDTDNSGSLEPPEIRQLARELGDGKELTEVRHRPEQCLSMIVTSPVVVCHERAWRSKTSACL